MEKRALVRKPAQASVACSSLTTNSPADVFTGTMLNCSCGGICIELNHWMQEGSIVMIKATGCTAIENPTGLLEGFRTLSVAEVKWSRPLDDHRTYNYAIGFRYLPN